MTHESVFLPHLQMSQFGVHVRSVLVPVRLFCIPYTFLNLFQAVVPTKSGVFDKLKGKKVVNRYVISDILAFVCFCRLCICEIAHDLLTKVTAKLTSRLGSLAFSFLLTGCFA